MSIINSVIKGGGTQPTGTKNITSNGVHNVAAYEYADVQVPTTAPAYYIEKTKDANNKLQNGSTIINLSGATDVGDYVLQYAYYQNTNISGTVDMSSLTTLSGSSCCSYMFSGCASISGVLDLSSLTTISGNSAGNNMFRNCTGITGVDLSSLTTISGQNGGNALFNGCTGLTSVVFSSLTSITFGGCSYMFNNCTNLTSLSFPAITTTSFGNNTNQFNGMLSGVTGCTVHFPSNLQSVIGSWSDVTAGFGGTNTTVLFDLSATA